MKEIYFMRHGKTKENAERMLTGQSDPPIIEEAREEIRSIRLYITKPDIIFTSDLRRTYETAELLFPDMKAIHLPLLRERSYGSLEGKPMNFMEAYGLKRGALHYLEDGHAILKETGVEPMSSLRERAKKALQMMREHSAHTILVIGHGSFLNVLVNNLILKKEIGPTLENLQYHRVVMDSQGTVVEIELYHKWTPRSKPQND